MTTLIVLIAYGIFSLFVGMVIGYVIAKNN